MSSRSLLVKPRHWAAGVCAAAAGVVAALSGLNATFGWPNLNIAALASTSGAAWVDGALVLLAAACAGAYAPMRSFQRAGAALAALVAVGVLAHVLAAAASSGSGGAQLAYAPVAAVLCTALALALANVGSSLAENLRQAFRLIGVAIAVFALALYAMKPAALAAVTGFGEVSLPNAAALALLHLAIGLARQSSTLRWRIAPVGVLALTPLAALTVYFASAERDIALKQVETRLAGLARLGVEQQDAVIEQVRRTLVFLARFPEIRTPGPACDATVARFASLNGLTSSLFVVGRSGDLLCSPGRSARPVSLGDRDYVRTAFATQSFTVSGYIVTKVQSRASIAVVQPLLLPDGAKVLVGAIINLEALGDPLDRLAAGGDREVVLTLVDKDGVVIARRPEDRDQIGAPAFSRAPADMLSARKAAFEAPGDGGEPFVFVARPLAFSEGQLIVGLPKRQIVEPIDARMNRRLGLISALLAASVALGVFGTEILVLRPVRRLTAYAQRLQGDDSEDRSPVGARGEIGMLSRALTATAAAIRDRERRLVEAEALFRGLFDHSPDSKAVLRVEPNDAFRVETWNGAAAQASGLRQEDVVGRTPAEIFPGGTGLALEADLRTAVDSRQPFAAEREAVVRGMPAAYEVVYVPLKDADGDVERVFVSARDISERKRVERMKTEFVSTVSHELRTPLTSIAGSLGLLAEGVAGPLGDKARHLIGIAHANSLRLVRLINDILDIEKIEAGRMAFDLGPVALEALVEDAVNGLRGYAQSFDVHVEVVGGTEATIVRGDADRLSQVATNLISNAIKFSPKGETVTVTIDVDGAAARLRVRDRGPGVPIGFRPHVFSKFAQADGSDSRRKGGTGLGLAIVKEIVERHAGSVGFVSEPGEGAEFQVRLPRIREERATASAPALDRRPCILVCEDDAIIGAILSEQLSDAGFRTILATTVRSAKAAATADVQAILVDLRLPDGHGITLIRDLRASAATAMTPIIVVSAEADAGRRDARAAMLDVVAWLEKPVDVQRLSGLLRDRLRPRGGRPKILHVEDDADLCKVVAAAVTPIADVVSARSLIEARARLVDTAFDLAIIDVALGDGSGLELLADLEATTPRPIPAIIFSAHDVDGDVAPQAAAALTKSRTSLSALVDAVRRLVGQPNSTDAGPVRRTRQG
ncbi:ATP-binding protein [Methylopila sp. 73B]|uniref:ATP-binding protein n=1 Tax=Methylopila sp. 73B TaxID=1120792 RepID=UPI0003786F1B|nr:ATP-binding protein [Methylopila sp. 73B]